MKKVVSLLMILALVVFTFPVVDAAKLDDEQSAFHNNNTTTSKDGLWEYQNNYISEYYGDEENITLPVMIDGHVMNGIGRIDNNKVKHITVPQNYVNVYSCAFSEMQELRSVTFSQNYSDTRQMSRFDALVFAHCPKLEKVVLPNRMVESSLWNQDLGKKIFGGRLPDSTFLDCPNLKDVTFPEGLVQIESEAFKGCTSIEKLVVPEGVLTVSVGAFADTPSLKTLVLPDSIEEGGLNGAFNDVSPSTTVVCGENSVAAKEIEERKQSSPSLYQFPVVNMTPTKVEGDVNNDGRFNIKDVTHLQKYLVGLVGAESVNNYVLDFNKDKKINIKDATMMQYNIARISFEDN